MQKNYTKLAAALLMAVSLAWAGTAEAQGRGKGKGKGPPEAQAPGNQGQAKGQRASRGRGQGRGPQTRAPGRGGGRSEQARRSAPVRLQQAARPNRGRAGAVRVPQQRPRTQAPAVTRRQQQQTATAPRQARGGRARSPQIRSRAQNFSGRSYNQVLQGFSRDRRPRSYWQQRSSRIILVAGGHYYLANNYWYPAWGYDSSYSRYVYDLPVYAYNGLPPDRVLREVQAQLQDLGYYRSAVDGLFGPITRNALRQFQADHGLPVTGAVDEATLYALGMI